MKSENAAQVVQIAMLNVRVNMLTKAGTIGRLNEEALGDAQASRRRRRRSQRRRRRRRHRRRPRQSQRRKRTRSQRRRRTRS